MRVWGRIATNTAGGDAEVLNVGTPSRWVAVTTDAQGYEDYPHITALIQCLKLNLGESPFYANFGVPARAAVRSQVPPDYAVAFTQSYFAPFFASLVITNASTPQTSTAAPVPTYQVSVIRNNGSSFQEKVAL